MRFCWTGMGQLFLIIEMANVSRIDLKTGETDGSSVV